MTLVMLLLLGARPAPAEAPQPFVVLDPANTRAGYLARLLINETPFPGERAWQSVSLGRGEGQGLTKQGRIFVESEALRIIAVH